MSYMLVEWVDEKEKLYSVLNTTNISDGELRRKGKKLIGVTAPIQWKRNEYRGKILEIGSEVELEKRADELAMDALTNDSKSDVGLGSKQRPKRGKKRKLENLERADAIDLVLSDIPIVDNLSVIPDVEAPADSCEEVNVEIENEQHYKAKYKALKLKYRELKKKYKTLLRENNKDILVELYPGSEVYLKKSDLDSVNHYSKQGTVLARNLFRFLFSTEELAGHSLFGKKCNANKEHIPLPAIDATKRNAVINYVLKVNNLDAGNDKNIKRQRKVMIHELNKSLSDFLREERRKFQSSSFETNPAV